MAVKNYERRWMTDARGIRIRAILVATSILATACSDAEPKKPAPKPNQPSEAPKTAPPTAAQPKATEAPKPASPAANAPTAAPTALPTTPELAPSGVATWCDFVKAQVTGVECFPPIGADRELGQFGSQSNELLGALATCFPGGALPAAMAPKATKVRIAAFNKVDTLAGIMEGKGLSRFASWLPAISLKGDKDTKVTVSVAVDDLSLDALGPFAAPLRAGLDATWPPSQEGKAIERCRAALCKIGAYVVQSTLTGVPRLTILSDRELDYTLVRGWKIDRTKNEKGHVITATPELGKRVLVAGQLANANADMTKDAVCTGYPAPCGATSQWCCAEADKACAEKNICRSHRCVECGGGGEPCCASEACEGSRLICASGTCIACGADDQPCCKGLRCRSDEATCRNETCVHCGRKGEPCCGTRCGAGLVCERGRCASPPGFGTGDTP